MDKNSLIQKIKLFITIAKLPQQDASFILGKLDSSTQQQLEKVHDNLLEQIVINMYFEFLDEIDAEKRLMTEEVEEELLKKFDARFDQVSENLLTETELNQVRGHIQAIQTQATQAMQPSTTPTPIAPTPVATPTTAPVAPTQPVPTPPTT
jgi:hypothetical protein